MTILSSLYARKGFPRFRPNHTVNGQTVGLLCCPDRCFVLVACRLDTVMGSTFIRDAVVIAFIANETISIVENAGLMGVPIPAAITKAIDILKQKAEEERQEEG